MRDIQENKHTMFKAVVSLLDGHVPKLFAYTCTCTCNHFIKDLVTAIEKDKDTLLIQRAKV